MILQDFIKGNNQYLKGVLRCKILLGEFFIVSFIDIIYKDFTSYSILKIILLLI